MKHTVLDWTLWDVSLSESSHFNELAAYRQSQEIANQSLLFQRERERERDKQRREGVDM